MSIRKMTFSLASLILIFAFGLVFGIMSVMADDGSVDSDGDHDPEGHADQATANTAEGNNANHKHPTVKISAEDADPNTAGIQVIDEDDATDGVQVKVTLTLLDEYDSNPFSGTEVEPLAHDGNDALGTASLTIGDFANPTGDDAAMKWEAIVTITGFPDIRTPAQISANDPTRDVAKDQAAAIMAGLMLTISVEAGAITSDDVSGDYVGNSNLATRMTFTVIAEEVEEMMDDPDPVMFKVTGTPSLTAPFTVTFTSTSEDEDTGDLMGAMFTEADIMVSAGDGFVVMGTLNDTSPSDAPMTVWQVIIQPVAGATKISITIADDDSTAPVADEDDGVLRIAGLTLTAIEASEGANDEAPFVVTLTFSDTVDELTMADLMVSPYDDPDDDADDDEEEAEIGDIAAVLGTDGKMWQVEITPVKGMATTLALAEDSDLGMGSVEMLTVKTKAAQAADASADDPTGDVTAAYAKGTGTTTGTTTISDGTIGANDFVVIRHGALPDLELFFDIGGTIGLDDGDDADDENSRSVVISEILWGLDFGETVLADQQTHQFIELYNTTAADIDLMGWELIFTRGNVVPASDIDQVSNRGRDGWEVDTGDTGKSGRVAETLADDPASTITPINIISMYRKIDYDKVEKVKDNGDPDPSREEQLKGIPGGNAIGSWANSEIRSTNRWIYSTPGERHHTRVGLLTPSSVAGTPFRINEIGNDTGGENDWVELHNVSDAEASLKNYALSMVTAKGTDTRLFHFPGQDWKIPAGGFVVVSTRHPSLTDLATGKDISIPDADELNKGLKHLYVVKPDWNLQDDGNFALILRSAHDKQGKGDNLIDVVATTNGAFEDNDISTSLWPLTAIGAPNGNVIDGGDENFGAGKVYQRNSGDGRGEKQFAVAGYTGIGYDVKAANVPSNRGTPGYDNGSNRDKVASLKGGVVTISEIMIDVGDARRNLPQWIELHNSSTTEGVNLNGWKINIENAVEEDGDLLTNTFSATVTLGAKTILPNQTVLVASSTGNVRDPNHFPPTRVVNLWTTKAHRDALEMTRSTDPVLSTRGFHIELVDKDGMTVDEAGNLDGVSRTRDEPTWMLPMSDAPDSRSSLLRVYDQKVAVDGTMEAAWILASDTILAFEVSHAYYGNADDVGSPGYRTGGPLPVSLSKFRPERLKDTGEVLVRWVTESELNNAGFNILRSEKRDSEFTKVHYVAGKGTTSERSLYEWKDTSAKPNVVYYYQIQDISLDGKVTTLRTTHLRGNVSAAGKATTTWGEIKALQ